MDKQIKTPKLSDSINKQLKEVDKYIDQFTPNNKQKNEVVFGICLISKTVAKDWNTVQENLSKTLRSILNNSDQNYKIIIVGHEKPTIKELENNHVTWISVDFPPPENSKEFGRDKNHKRRIIGKFLYDNDYSGYFMSLDADDWIHYRFVELIRAMPRSDAFIFKKGYMVNQKHNEVWIKDNFYRGCGSSAVFYFTKGEFPSTTNYQDSQKTPYRVVMKRHRFVAENLTEINKGYKIIDIPLVTYFIGHGENWSKPDKNLTAHNYKKKGQQVEDWFYKYFKAKNI